MFRDLNTIDTPSKCAPPKLESGIREVVMVQVRTYKCPFEVRAQNRESVNSVARLVLFFCLSLIAAVVAKAMTH